MDNQTDYQIMVKTYENMGFPVLTLAQLTKDEDCTNTGMLSLSRVEMELAAKLEGVDLSQEDGFVPSMFQSNKQQQIEFAILLFNVYENVRSVTAFLFDADGKFVNYTAMSD